MIPLSLAQGASISSLVMQAINRLRDRYESGKVQCDCPGAKVACIDCLKVELEQLISDDIGDLGLRFEEDVEVVAQDIDRLTSKYLASFYSELLNSGMQTGSKIAKKADIFFSDPEEMYTTGPLPPSTQAAKDGAIDPDNIDYEEERRELETNYSKVTPEERGFNEDVAKIMQDNGLVPIASSSGFGLGKGAYGFVFRASLDGKQVAVKITEESGDFNVWTRILEVTNEAPDSIKKHLPKIYALSHDSESGLYLIAMELLAQMPGAVAERLFNEDTPPFTVDFSSNFSKIFKDEELLWSLFDRAWTSYNDLISRVPEEEKHLFFKDVLNYVPPMGARRSTVEDSFLVYTNGVIKNRLAKYVVPPGTEGLGVDTLGMFPDTLLSIISQVAKPSSDFPMNNDTWGGEDKVFVYKNIPESKSLLAALEYLESNGIHWSDLHSANLMSRPSTGDLVIIDVGLYDLR